jgi:hypothetical protein
MKSTLSLIILIFFLQLGYGQQVSAGDDIGTVICLIDEVVLDGSAPPVGTTGTWTQIEGPYNLELSNPNDPNAQIINEVTGLYILEWRVQGEGPLGFMNEADTMQITSYWVEPDIVTCGPDIELVCINSFTLEAIGNDFPNNGVWSIISGGGVISDLEASTTSVSDLPVGANTFRWTYYTLCDTLWDEITINVFSLPAVDAGPDFDFCIFDVSMELTEPTVQGPWSGSWAGQDISSDGVFTPSTTGQYTLTYTNTILPDCSVSDEIVVTVWDSGEPCGFINVPNVHSVLNESFHVYEVNNQLVISNSEKLQYLEIYDSTGKLVFQREHDFSNIILPKNKGILLLRFQKINGQINIQKFCNAH